MKASTRALLDAGVQRNPALHVCMPALRNATDILTESFRSGGKLLTCGNGGSAADAQHIVGELMKGFVLPRPLPESDVRRLCVLFEEGPYLSSHLQGALPALSLVSENALQSAYANDVAPDLVFAQQVYGYGREGDVLLALSTSGNSANVIYAAQVAKVKGMQVVALTGEGGGRLKEIADCTVAVPERETYRVQELHLPVYHSLCLAVENEFYGI